MKEVFIMSEKGDVIVNMEKIGSMIRKANELAGVYLRLLDARKEQK
jgi:hypothetical protein